MRNLLPHSKIDFKKLQGRYIFKDDETGRINLIDLDFLGHGCFSLGSALKIVEHYKLPHKKFRELSGFYRYTDKNKEEFRQTFRKILSIADRKNITLVLLASYSKAYGSCENVVSSQEMLEKYYQTFGFQYFDEIDISLCKYCMIRFPQKELDNDSEMI